MGFFEKFKRRPDDTAEAAPPPADVQGNTGFGATMSAFRAAAQSRLKNMPRESKDVREGSSSVRLPIGKTEIRQAYQILLKYREGKANLERRVVENEKWYRLRHWDFIDPADSDAIKPASAWLFNSIANKHADAMDNYPSPNILPREEGDREEAKRLSSIVPVVLDQNDFEQVYSDVWTYKLRSGTGIYGVFWDESKHNGLGDIAIKKCDILSLFWESGITDIQHSKNVFSAELVDNDSLIQDYPQLEGRLGRKGVETATYFYDDTVDTSDKSLVIDWYYKKNVNGRAVLHYCKFCNDEILFATENSGDYAERGWYDHGLYPFVFDPLYTVEGSPCGFGYIDIGKSAQMYIDKSDQAIMENMLANTRPRHFVRSDGAINEAEYLDLSRPLVHVDGNLGADSIQPINGKTLPSVYVEVRNNKIDELKETTGNRDISTGGSASGVTAASAIAAMQEAGSKLSRDNNKASYRAYKQIVLMVIELIRQFYDMPRQFRIIGESGAAEYITYANSGIRLQQQELYGINMGIRIPVFDVEVTAQKQSPYSKMSQNELALQFYNAGFFNPQLADQALLCLDMMDFDRKDFVRQKIAENQAMFNLRMMMMQGQAVPQEAPSGKEEDQSVEHNNSLGGDERDAGESGVTKNARERVAESTSPR